MVAIVETSRSVGVPDTMIWAESDCQSPLFHSRQERRWSCSTTTAIVPPLSISAKPSIGAAASGELSGAHPLSDEFAPFLCQIHTFGPSATTTKRSALLSNHMGGRKYF